MTATSTGRALSLAISISAAVSTAISFTPAGVGSLVTGLQTMPSIAWFPLALLVFGYTERAITFVVILGAAPSVANGIIAGVDHVPPALLRVARTLGAHGFGLYRHVVVPAAMPTYVSGLKQGWAFSWRSLMAGELIIVGLGKTSLGGQLTLAREFIDAPGVIAMMIVILIFGLVVDFFFSKADKHIRNRWGLIDHGAS